MKLLYFAKIREILKKSEETVSLPSNIITTGDLIDYLMNLEDSYKIAFEDKKFFIAVDEEFVKMDFIITNSKICLTTYQQKSQTF